MARSMSGRLLARIRMSREASANRRMVRTDQQPFDWATEHERVLVTENVKDSSASGASQPKRAGPRPVRSTLA